MDTQSLIGVPDLLERRDTSGLVRGNAVDCEFRSLSVCFVTFLVYIPYIFVVDTEFTSSLSWWRSLRNIFRLQYFPLQ